MSEDVCSMIDGFFIKSATSDDVIRISKNPEFNTAEYRKRNLSLFYTRLSALGYNSTELQDILNCDENMLIVSGAGSGKTTSLILKIIRDLVSGKLITKLVVYGEDVYVPAKILVCTFLRSGAKELGKAFDEWCKKLHIEGISSSQITFKTISAEVHMVMSNMGSPVNIAQKDILDEFIGQVMNTYNIHSLGSTSRRATIDEKADISNLMGYVRNRRDSDRYNHPLMAEYNLDSMQMDLMIDLFKKLKACAGVKDFEDLEEELLDGYQYSKVLDYIQSRYDFLYVDEFQDTSQLQYEVLKPYFNSAKGFLCIGDDDQTIYSWRGSDIHIITEVFEHDYHPKLFQLTMNYRCCRDILDSVIPSIEKNTFRHPKKLQASKAGGELTVIVDGGITELLKSVKEDIACERTVGILGRTNNDLLIPAMLLELDDAKIDFTVSGSLSLTSGVTRQIFGVMELLLQRYTENFSTWLNLFVGKYKQYEVKKLCDVLVMNRSLSLFTLPLEDIQYSAPTLFPMLRTLRQDYKISPVKAYLTLLQYMEQDVYPGKTIYAQRARDVIYFVRGIITEHVKVKEMSLEEIQTLFTTTMVNKFAARIPQFSARKKVNGRYVDVEDTSVTDTSKVRITTVHDSKGKQWDSVYIWNDVEGTFPNFVGNRELTTDEFEEERRVHYIAYTRPVYKLTIFTRSDKNSGFLGECDLSKAKILNKSTLNSSLMLNSVVLDKSKKQVSTDTESNKPSYIAKFQAFYKKYSDYSYMCSAIGKNLEVCDRKLGGTQGVKSYLESKGINNYPEDMLDETFALLVEEKANELV